MGGLGPWGWSHLAFFGLVIPWAAARSKRRLDLAGAPPRPAFFRGVILQQLVFIVMALAVGGIEGLTLLPATVPSLPALLVTVVLFLASWAGMRPPWRAAVEAGEARVELTSPRTPAERRLWAGLSLAAGIGEELTYRGVIYLLCLRLTASPPAAALLSALLFGAAHAVQGWRAMGVTALFGLAAQALTGFSGSLYAAMAWHAGYDLVAGWEYGRLAARRPGAVTGDEGPPSRTEGGPDRRATRGG